MDTRSADEIEDLEVVAYLLQMARSEKYFDLKPMFEDALRYFSQLSRERMLACVDKLASVLQEADYDEFKSIPQRYTRQELALKKRLRQDLLDPGL